MQLDRSVSEGQDESRNTSFLERTLSDGSFFEAQSFLTTRCLFNIRESEAWLVSPIAQLVRAPH